MNKYVKEYLQRGFAFAGLGPIVLGIVYAVLGSTVEGFSLSGVEVLVAILSTYAIAFVQAGASVINQIEEWSFAKAVLIHMGSIYAVYLIAYLVNAWIPFEPLFVLMFTGIFVLVYLVVWLVVFISVKLATRAMNKKIAK